MGIYVIIYVIVIRYKTRPLTFYLNLAIIVYPYEDYILIYYIIHCIVVALPLRLFVQQKPTMFGVSHKFPLFRQPFTAVFITFSFIFG